jgi:hypothetical protein
MSKKFTISLIGSSLLAVLLVLLSYWYSSRGNRSWGSHGITAYEVAIAYILIGTTCVFFKKTLPIGQAFLLVGLMMFLVGYSICTGLIK